VGIAAALTAYGVSPGIRHAVGHAEHSVRHAVGNIFDHDTPAARGHVVKHARHATRTSRSSGRARRTHATAPARKRSGAARAKAVHRRT
jgi:hypothetical protein